MDELVQVAEGLAGSRRMSSRRVLKGVGGEAVGVGGETKRWKWQKFERERDGGSSGGGY